MLTKNQLEVYLISSILTANKYRDDNGDLNRSNFKSMYLYNTMQINYGLSKEARWNIGMDINMIRARIDDDRNSSLFKVFSSEVDGNSRTATAITSIGPRLRFNPFQNNRSFNIQSSILFPVPYSEDKETILGQNQVFFNNMFLYNQPLAERIFLFSQLGIQYGFKKENVSAKFFPSATGYLSYFIPKRTILFALISYTPLFMKENSWNYSASSLQTGGGIQYQISKSLLVNAYYSTNIAGTNFQDFSSYNISVRYVYN